MGIDTTHGHTDPLPPPFTLVWPHQASAGFLLTWLSLKRKMPETVISVQHYDMVFDTPWDSFLSSGMQQFSNFHTMFPLPWSVMVKSDVEVCTHRTSLLQMQDRMHHPASKDVYTLC